MTCAPSESPARARPPRCVGFTRRWPRRRSPGNSGSSGIWAFSTLLGIAFYGRQQKRIDAALERGDDAAVRRHLDRYYWVSRLDVFGLVSAVFVMATKPFL